MPYRNPDNRRSTERYPVRVEARIRLCRGGADEPWAAGHVLSVSISGIFIASPQCFSPGDPVEIELPFPDGMECLQGDVRWASNGEPCGAGVAFRNLDDALRDRIRGASASGFWLHPTTSPATETPESMEDLDYFDTDPNDLIDDII